MRHNPENNSTKKKPVLRPPRKKNPFYYVKVGIIVFAVIIAITTFDYRQSINNPVDPTSTDEISVIIKQKDTIKEIGTILEEKGLINSGWAFYWYTRFNDLDESIVAGRFKLNPTMTTIEVVETISDANNSEAVITIQEGLRVIDIDQKLAELELAPEGAFKEAVKNFNTEDYEYYPFLDQAHLTSPITNPNENTILLEYPLEGYLYPDTYFLEPSNFTVTSLIYKCLNNFKNKIETETPNILIQSQHTLHEITTMASILEKEVRGFEDQQIVAGILWKRLNSGWRLDADATLLYTKEDNKITKADLESNNPYNTRKLLGLPPGPIGNPSIQSIKAASNPTKTNYWFYLTDKDGNVIYATSNEQHNVNKARYL